MNVRQLFPPGRTIVGVCALILTWWIAPAFKQMRENGQMTDARAISIMMFEYANDNGGQYPTGRTSTEIFQKLIDGGYVSDRNAESSARGAAIFYELYPGKKPATSDKLQPENVAWDVIVPADNLMPDQMPVLLLTGYRLALRSGGSAEPRAWPLRSWGDWMENIDYPRGYVVFVLKGNGTFIRKAGEDGVVREVISSDVNLSGREYRQLTPDGSSP